MLFLIRKLWLGCFLILVCSAILLLTSVRREEDVKRVAVLQTVSRQSLDDVYQGVEDTLRRFGYEKGRNLDIRRYIAEGDMATLHTMALEIVEQKYDLAIAITTPALQALHRVGGEGKVPFVFTCISDPYLAIPTLDRNHPDIHPAYMTGLGTRYDIRSTIAYAKAMNPGLRRIGHVWNNAEDNSRIQRDDLAALCTEMGLELQEATAENLTAVLNALQSVLSRGAECFYISGDSTVLSASEPFIAEALKHGLPTFTVSAEHLDVGALFTLGSDYYGMGVKAVEMGVTVLAGGSLAGAPIIDYNPPWLGINQSVPQRLRATWRFTDEMEEKACLIVDAAGQYVRRAGREEAAEKPSLVPGRTYRVGLLYFSPGPDLEVAVAGLRAELPRLGLVEGKNLDLRLAHAQGEVANIPLILDGFVADHVDAVVVLTTPCLLGAIQKVKNVPVIFACVFDPYIAGAGKSAEDHLPNVTGIASPPPIRASFEAYRAFLPKMKRVGLVYCTSELSMTRSVAEARAVCADMGLELEEIGVTASHESYQATQALIQRGVDTIWIGGDNTVLMAFDAVAKVAREAGVPLVNSDPEFLAAGSLLSVGFDIGSVAAAVGDPLVRALTGTSPADIPFRDITVPTYAVNMERLKAFNLSIPPAYRDRVTMFSGVGAARGGPVRLAFVNMDRSLTLDAAEAGFFRGLRDAYLLEGTDYVVTRYCANGEISLLPTLMDAARENGAEYLATCGTPTLMAALEHARGLPTVFTVASRADRLGIANLPRDFCGYHDDPPIAELLDFAATQEPRIARVGTVYDPAQRNVQIAVAKLREVCAKRGIALEEKSCARVSDLPDTVRALLETRPDILLLSSDNLTSVGFPIIAKAAVMARVPIYSTEPDFIGKGLKGAIGADFSQWGYLSGLMAGRLMAGVATPEMLGRLPLPTSDPVLDADWMRNAGP